MRRGVLALDQGGHASRACIIDESGEIIAQRQIPIGTVRGSAGEVEHDADEIVASLRTAAVAAIRSAGAVIIDAAGLATQRSTIVCFERGSGDALSPAISWQDRRNAQWLDSFSMHAKRVSVTQRAQPPTRFEPQRLAPQDLCALQARRARFEAALNA